MKSNRMARRTFLTGSTKVTGAGVLSLLTRPLLRAVAQTASATSPSTQLEALLEKIGGGGGYIPPQASTLSAASFSDELAQTRALLQQLHAIDATRLSKDESIDLRFAESILAGRELTQGSLMRWKKDPRTYLQLHNLSALVTMPDPDADRARQVIALLTDLPPRLQNGQKNLEVCIPRFRELSLFMIDNALAVFRDEVPAFAEKLPATKAEIMRANSACLAALQQYQTFVRDTLPLKPKVGFAIGRGTYDAMLKRQYMLDYNADTLYAFAWDQFKSTVKAAQDVASKIDPTKPWLEVAAKIKQDGPDPLKIIEAHQLWVDHARDHVHSHNLVPIPWPNRVDVVPRAEYLRKTSYYGNFSGARKPDKDGILVGQWRINTYLPTWTDAEKHDYMVEHDWGVIIDTAPHETYCGHHVQMLYQLHNPDKFRRNSSISIFSEGWGLYVEHLMQETGFFPNEGIHLRQLQLRLWRIVRVIYDVGMNNGKLSYDEAVKLMVDQVGFQKWAAELEVDSAAERPGYMLGYFMGCTEIQHMREDFIKLRGSQFTYCDFHERLLKVGCMPPSLMREGLMSSLSI